MLLVLPLQLQLLLRQSPAWFMGMPVFFPSHVSLISSSACDPARKRCDEAAGKAASRDCAWHCCYCCTHQDQLGLVFDRAS
jgi:hypothetical protein